MTKKDLMARIMAQGDDQEVFIMDGGREVPLEQITLKADISHGEDGGRPYVVGVTRIVLGRIDNLPPGSSSYWDWFRHPINSALNYVMNHGRKHGDM